MTVFKQALANAKLFILLLLLINGILASVAFYAINGLINAPTKMDLYVPPAIPDTGMFVKVGEIPSSTVYSFAYYIWQSLQTWNTNGEVDYQKNILTFAPYLTDSFKDELKSESVALDNQGLLLNHEQETFNADNTGFDPNNVKYIGNNTWLVHLVLRTVNRVATDKDNGSFSESHVVQDATTSYVFKVIKTDAAISNNHWQLQIAGFAVAPKTITIYQ